jgi:hypothetical protein
VDPFVAHTLGRTQQLRVHLPDSDERAMGYLAGPAPNKWGVFSNGSTVSELLARRFKNKQEPYREHPLFGYVSLQVLQEVSRVVTTHIKFLLVIINSYTHTHRWRIVACSQSCARSGG